MVDKVYVVWCKTNKNTDKFDLGVFIDRDKANKVIDKNAQSMAELWVEEYKISKPYGRK